MPVVALCIASIMWGLTWWPLKALNAAGFGGLSVIALSFGVLAFVSTPVLIRQRQSWWSQKPQMALIGFLGGTANVAFAYALIHGDVVRVMVLFYLLPIWGVLGGRILLKEQIDIWRWLGVCLAIGGAFIVLGGAQLFSTAPSWIDLLALISGFALAMTNLAFRAVQTIPVVPKVIATFYGCMILAVLCLFLGSESFEYGHSNSAWLGLLSYALLWLLLTSLTSQWAVTQLEAGRSSIIIIMELVAAVVSATLIRGEVLTVQEVVGGILILIAALIEALRDLKTGDSAKELTSQV